jgi:glutaredoxin 2
MSALGQKQTFALQKAMSALSPESLTLFDHLDRAGDARLPPVERTERKQKIKRLAERVLSQKAVPYMFQSGTEAANWIRSQESQTWPRATDAINLSQFARKIFLAPSSNRGT